MDNENSVMLKSCREDAILIETVKSIVSHNECNGIENVEQSFFLVTDVQDEQPKQIEINGESCPMNQSEEHLLLSSLCRICANAHDHLIPIFEGEGAQHELCSKIHKYLPIHITQNDTLPLQLCYHCAATLLAWHELVEGCLNAECKLIEMESSLPEKHQYLPTSTELKTSSQTVTTTVNAAESCSREETALKQDRIIETTVSSSNRFTEHSIQLASEYDSDNSNDSEMDNTLERQSSHNRDLKKYFSSTIGGQTQKIQTKTERNTERQEHTVKSKRTKEQRAEMKRSKIIVNGCTYYKCCDCDKVLSTSYNFLIHRNIHKGEKLYTCHFCGKGFCSASSLNRHMRDVHAGIKNFSCDICGRCLASKSSRDEHRRTHTGERPHVCETCGKSFRQKASLHVHKLYHSKEFPHKCPLCERAFRRKQELNRHVYVHTEQKPYSCDLCEKRFRSQGCISRHRRTHNKQKLYACTICGTRFSQERYLKNHNRNLHKFTHTAA